MDKDLFSDSLLQLEGSIDGVRSQINELFVPANEETKKNVKKILPISKKVVEFSQFTDFKQPRHVDNFLNLYGYEDPWVTRMASHVLSGACTFTKRDSRNRLTVILFAQAQNKDTSPLQKAHAIRTLGNLPLTTADSNRLCEIVQNVVKTLSVIGGTQKLSRSKSLFGRSSDVSLTGVIPPSDSSILLCSALSVLDKMCSQAGTLQRAEIVADVKQALIDILLTRTDAQSPLAALHLISSLFSPTTSPVISTTSPPADIVLSQVDDNCPADAFSHILHDLLSSLAEILPVGLLLLAPTKPPEESTPTKRRSTIFGSLSKEKEKSLTEKKDPSKPTIPNLDQNPKIKSILASICLSAHLFYKNSHYDPDTISEFSGKFENCLWELYGSVITAGGGGANLDMTNGALSACVLAIAGLCESKRCVDDRLLSGFDRLQKLFLSAAKEADQPLISTSLKCIAALARAWVVCGGPYARGAASPDFATNTTKLLSGVSSLLWPLASRYLNPYVRAHAFCALLWTSGGPTNSAYTTEAYFRTASMNDVDGIDTDPFVQTAELMCRDMQDTKLLMPVHAATDLVAAFIDRLVHFPSPSSLHTQSIHKLIHAYLNLLSTSQPTSDPSSTLSQHQSSTPAEDSSTLNPISSNASNPGYVDPKFGTRVGLANFSSATLSASSIGTPDPMKPVPAAPFWYGDVIDGLWNRVIGGAVGSELRAVKWVIKVLLKLIDNLPPSISRDSSLLHGAFHCLSSVIHCAAVKCNLIGGKEKLLDEFLQPVLARMQSHIMTGNTQTKLAALNAMICMCVRSGNPQIWLQCYEFLSSLFFSPDVLSSSTLHSCTQALDTCFESLSLFTTLSSKGVENCTDDEVFEFFVAHETAKHKIRLLCGYLPISHTLHGRSSGPFLGRGWQISQNKNHTLLMPSSQRLPKLQSIADQRSNERKKALEVEAEAYKAERKRRESNVGLLKAQSPQQQSDGRRKSFDSSSSSSLLSLSTMSPLDDPFPSSAQSSPAPSQTTSTSQQQQQTPTIATSSPLDLDLFSDPYAGITTPSPPPPPPARPSLPPSSLQPPPSPSATLSLPDMPPSGISKSMSFPALPTHLTSPPKPATSSPSNGGGATNATTTTMDDLFGDSNSSVPMTPPPPSKPPHEEDDDPWGDKDTYAAKPKIVIKIADKSSLPASAADITAAASSLKMALPSTAGGKKKKAVSISTPPPSSTSNASLVTPPAAVAGGGQPPSPLF